MKRIVSWVLTVMMIIGMLGSFSTTAFAAIDTSNPILITQWHDQSGTIKDGFGVLVASGNSGDFVEFVWQDAYYKAEVGVQAFTSVEAAISAGKKQLIVPATEISTINITGSIELYGNHFGQNPNTVPSDKTEDWTLNPDWKNNKSVVTGNINIASKASPLSSKGTNIVIDGIELKGFFVDNVRPISKYATDISLKNILFSFNKATSSTHYVINLETPHATSDDASVLNVDSFAVENSRFDFATSNSATRIMNEDSPKTVIVKNNYFAKNYARIGWFKQRACVKNGYLEVSGNYFNNGGYIIHFCGGVNYFDAKSYDTNSVAKFNNNIVIDSTAAGAVVITPECFAYTEVNGNVFVDSKTLHQHAISVYNYRADSPAGVNYADVLSVNGNRFVGVSDHLLLNNGTPKLDESNKNYYAVYTEDYSSGKNGAPVYGALEGNDYYLDFAASTLASDMEMAISRDGMAVNGSAKTASVILAKDEQNAPQLKTNSGVDFAYYTDKDCKKAATSLEGGKAYYAKAVNEYGVSVVYTVYVSVGNVSAPEYTDAYLLYDECADMPVGTKFTATYKGTEYMFTAGVNAFASLSQISVQNAMDGGADEINVIMLDGVYEGGDKVTGNFNIVGDNTVLKNDFVTDEPVKIACVGDSITEAVIDNKRATWGYPARLNDLLDASYGEGKYEVKNFGKGNSSLQEINTTIDTGIAANRSQYNQGSWYYSALDYNPDVVLVMIGHNDTQVSETDHIYKSAANYKKYYVELIESFKALPSNPQVIIVSCHSRSDAFRKDLIEKCIIPVQKELAEEYNTIFVDTYTSTDGMKSAADGVYSSDGLHLTPKGYAFLAGLIKDDMEGAFSENRTVKTEGITVDNSAEVKAKTQPIKVAAMGDDVTYGSKAYVNYPMALDEILGDGFDVRNYGECKATTSNYINNTSYPEISDYESALAWKPDVAILGFGINNSANTAFVNNYKTIIEALQANGTTVILTTSLRKTVNEKITELATEYGLILIDVYTEVQTWDSDCKQTTTLLTEKGNEKLAAFLAKEIFDVTVTASDDDDTSYLTAPQFKDYDYTFVPVTDAPLFTDRNDSEEIIKNDAVAVIASASLKTSGDSIIARWDGEYYKFTVGVNAFGTVADALATDAKQVIVPTGNISKFEITRSVEIYGENYEVEPWVAQGDKVAQNEAWGKTGDTVIKNADVVITESATPKDESGTTIVISGFRFTHGINDTARKLSNYKTSITLKNNILDRCYETSEFREFNLHNANNVNYTDATAVNNDEFTIKNMFFVNRSANTSHALFQEQVPSYFTIDGFGCNADMATLGFPKWSIGTKTGKMTLTNSFIKDNSDHSSRFGYVVNFSGHSSNVNLSDEQIASLDLSLELKDNHFINCYDGGTEGAIVIWPASFTSINVDGNTVVSTDDLNCRAIQWQGSTTFRPNDKDFTNRITFVNNRIIGYMASHYVNDLTELDLSNNYFETYTLSYRNGVTGDIPADIDANYYLDYALTTKVGDMAPKSEGTIANLTTSSITRTMYGYATGNVENFAFTNDNDVTYKVYSDAECKNEITSLDVTVGSASKAYVKANRGKIAMVYTLYVMGIKSLDDINAEMNTTLTGIEEPTLWYPSLYGAANGIEVISYYDGAPVKFTTGKDVASSTGEMGLYGDDIIFPDDITEIDGLELVTAVNVYSAVANINGVTMRKVKIACVGDSITDGVINSSRQYSYPTTMQNLLGTASFDIQNYGGSGATAQYIEYLRLNATAGDRERQYRVLRKSMYDQSISYNGDVVIIGLGANDSSIAEPVRWLSNDNFMNQYIDLIREYQALPSKPAVYLTITTERYDSAIAGVMVNENMRYIEQIIADMTGAKVIDLHTLMDYMYDPAGTSYSDDKLHPNSKGYQEMGKIIAEQVTSTFAPIGDNTSSINGVTLTGTVSSSVAKTGLAISNSTIVADAPVIKSSNIVSLALHNTVVNKDGKAVAKVDITDLVNNTSSLEIDLATADTEKTYDATINTRTLPVTVSNDDPVALLKAVQAASAGNQLENEGHDWVLTVDVDTLASDVAAAAVTTLRNGGKHVLNDVAELLPDCENGGHNAHKACALCDYTEGYVGTAPLGHKGEKVTGVQATCTVDGYKDYYKCTVCEKLFADENCTAAIADIEAWKKADGKIAATGHAWGEYVYNNDATAEADGTKTRECSVCHEKETVTAEGTKITVTIVDTSKIFTDVKAGKWYTNAINYAYSYGFIAGVSKTEFGLNTAVTRGMFITILARIAGVDTTTKGVNNVNTKFTDVKSGKYYTAAIKWANDNGIVSGTSDTTFGPENAISRQDLCVMVVNFAKFMNVELTASKDEISFADAASISKYAKSAVKTCQMAEIVSGYNVTGGVEFRPKNTATRAEAAQILYKFHLDFIA